MPSGPGRAAAAEWSRTARLGGLAPVTVVVVWVAAGVLRGSGSARGSGGSAGGGGAARRPSCCFCCCCWVVPLRPVSGAAAAAVTRRGALPWESSRPERDDVREPLCDDRLSVVLPSAQYWRNTTKLFDCGM